MTQAAATQYSNHRDPDRGYAPRSPVCGQGLLQCLCDGSADGEWVVEAALDLAKDRGRPDWTLEDDR